MARVKNDGSLRGKVANLVYTGWKDTNVVRVDPDNVKRPNTDAQLAQNMKIKLASNFLRHISPVLKIGYQAPQRCKTGMNEARSWFYKNIVAGIYPGQYIDYSKVIVSRGLISPPVDVAVSRDGTQLTFTWNTATSNKYSSRKDFLAVLLFSPGNSGSDQVSSAAEPSIGMPSDSEPSSPMKFYDLRAASRIDGMATISMPESMTAPLHAWVFFYNPDRDTDENQAKISDSVYQVIV